MGSQLQDVVRKIFGDEKSKAQFQADPRGFLAKFDLSETDKRAVISTNAKLGLIGSGSTQLAATLKGNEGWFAPAP